MKIAGYAAVFDHPDRGGDIVRRGAFASAPPSGLPLLWQHDPAQRIGTVDHLAEDDRGLRVIATLTDGRSVAPGDGLSFGYRVLQSRTGTYRELLSLEILEVSLVAHPMQPRARVIAISPLPLASEGSVDPPDRPDQSGGLITPSLAGGGESDPPSKLAGNAHP